MNWRWLLGLLCCLGCGRDQAPPTAVRGSAAGVLFSAPVAFFRVEKRELSKDWVEVLITDDPSACDHLFSSPTNGASSGSGGVRSLVMSPEAFRGDAGLVEDGGPITLPSLFLAFERGGSTQSQNNLAPFADFDPGCRNLPPPDGGRTGEDSLDPNAVHEGRWFCANNLRFPNAVRIEPQNVDDQASDPQVSGSFSVTLPDGSFQGTFQARRCDAISLPAFGGCSSAGGGAGLALWAGLALALRRSSLPRRSERNRVRRA